jgi:uncharacterized protein (DUF4415 family)
MGNTVRLRIKIDRDVKPAFRAKCIIAETNMSQQSEVLCKNWTESNDYRLTHQAKLSMAQDSPEEEVAIDIDADIKKRFNAKCKQEEISMSRMLEVLYIDWIG